MEGGERSRLEDYTVGSLPTIIYIPNFISSSEQDQLIHHIYEVPSSKWKSLKNRRLQNWGGVVHEKGLLPQDLPPWLTIITHRICEQTGLFPSPINHVLINEYLPDQGIMPHQDGPAYFPVVAILSLGSPVVIDFNPHTRLKECKNVEKRIADDLDSGRSELVAKSDDQSHELTRRQAVDQYQSSLLLMPCSLLIFKDEAYSDYLHGIADSVVQRLDKAVNVFEALKDQEQNSSILEETFEFKDHKQPYSIRRTATRLSLTCRLVSKVHKNLFKF